MENHNKESLKTSVFRGSQYFISCYFTVLILFAHTSCDMITEPYSSSLSDDHQTTLTITGIPDNLNCDDNRLLVFLPYVVSSGSIQTLMSWLVIEDKPEITSNSVTARFTENIGRRRIFLAAPRGDDINNWTFWTYSNGENINFNITDYNSSPVYEFSGNNTLSWNKFKMIPIGNWPEESVVTIPASISQINLTQGSLEDKLLLIAESGSSNAQYNIIIENDITVNPLTLSTSGSNVFVKLKGNSSFNPSTIKLGNYGSLLTVNAPLTLVLEDIILQGGTGNTMPLVNIENNGRILLGDGAILAGNSNIQTLGGGVFIKSGVLIVDGGSINGNESTKYPSGSGGGVYVDDDGRLYLKRGMISNNSAYNGGGVYVNQAIFIMTGGEISGNNADSGGGVYLSDASNAIGAGTVSANTVNFKKTPHFGPGTSGIIYGSIAQDGKSNNANVGSCLYYHWAKGYWYYTRDRTLNEYDRIDSDNRLVNWDFRNGGIWNPDLTNNIPENYVNLSGLTPKSAPSGSLDEIFRTIAQSYDYGVIYDIVVSSDQVLGTQHILTRGENVVIRLRSPEGSAKTITLADKGVLFYVYNHITLILQNIELRGIPDNNSPLIYVNGTVCIEDGTAICQNINVTGTSGGIFADTGGHLIMNGGEIRDNKCLDYDHGSGGGVMLYTSSYFHMNNGRIYNNFAEEEGGGVCVYKSTFIMYNGEIFGNEGFQGGGVFLDGSDFRKQVAFGQTVSGKIYDNTVPVGKTKHPGFFPSRAAGKNIYAGDRGADSNIDETQHMTTSNMSVPPWEKL
jgi:hypothetical protein